MASLNAITVSLCIVVLTAAALVRPTWSAAEDKPNIILFLIDDLGWNDTGYQGADYTTPTIDRLAQEGIRLKQYYVQPLCSPSRSALLAGRYPYNLGLAHGVITNGHPFGLGLQETTFPQRLKDGGYATHVVGKWDLGMHQWDYTPINRGFDTFYGFYGADEDYFTHVYDTVYQTMNISGVDFRNNKDPLKSENGSYSTNLFTQAIQQAIENHDAKNGPFFVYGAYQTVHTPLEVPDHYKDLATCANIPYADRKTFCGMMQALDEGINNITRTLKSKLYYNNTVIIFSTDNGGQTSSGSSNWPLRGNKGTVFEGGVRGFSFVWGKMLPKTNYDYSGLMHITDWYRTIVEGIAGLKLSSNETNHLDGYNMWQTIMANSSSSRSEILLQLDPHSDDNPLEQAALRSGDLKLIMGKPDCNTKYLQCPTGWVHLNGTIDPPPANPDMIWLFDVATDPLEKNNVVANAAHKDKLDAMKKTLQDFRSKGVVQQNPPFDPESDPKKHDGVWTPWL